MDGIYEAMRRVRGYGTTEAVADEWVSHFEYLAGEFAEFCESVGIQATRDPNATCWCLQPMAKTGGHVGDTRWMRSAQKQELPVWLL